MVISSINRKAFIVVLLALVTGLGCSVRTTPTPVAPKVSFSWTKSGACTTPGSVPITFAIVSPRFAKVAGTGSYMDAYAGANVQIATWIKPRQDLYEEFASSMRNDFLSLLTCKGFTTRGPFVSYEEMVFPDRIGSDLVLAPEIDLRLAVESEALPPSLGSAILGGVLGAGRRGPPPSKLRGQATLSGRVTVAIRESVTDTRMWTRSIEVTPETFEFLSSREYPSTAAMLYNEIVTGDPGFLAALGPKLLAIYSKALTATWNYTSPQEMRLVKSQSLDPRRRAVSGMSK